MSKEPNSQAQTSGEAQQKAAASRLGLDLSSGSAALTPASLLASLGGWLGIVESILPSTAFVFVYVIWQDTVAALITAVALSIGFIARQLISKAPVTQSIAGAVGVAFTCWITLGTGEAQPENYFVTGFVTNISYGSVLLLSILLRWPLLGLMVGWLRGTPTEWRKDRALMVRANVATGLFVGLFAARLLVQVPLFLAENITALGVARVVMGVPCYAAVIWLSWLLLRGSIRQQP